MATAVPKTMKALQITKEGNTTSIKLTELPTPTPKDGEILLKVHASPILPSDILNSKGSFAITTFPRVPGRDFAGTIVAGDEKRIGQSIFGTSGPLLSFTADGAHAEYCVIPTAAAVPLPHGLSFPQAANLGTTFTTANIALQRARTRPTDTVLVLGASGAVGSAAVQLARRLGCRVLRVGRSADMDVNSVTDPTLSAARTLTGGEGPDVVVDTVGDAALVKASLGVLKVRGRFSFITAPRGESVVGVDFLDVYRREIELVGCNSTRHSVEEGAEMLRGMVEGFEDGGLRAVEEGRLGKVGLEGAVEAYGGKGKATIVME